LESTIGDVKPLLDEQSTDKLDPKYLSTSSAIDPNTGLSIKNLNLSNVTTDNTSVNMGANKAGVSRNYAVGNEEKIASGKSLSPEAIAQREHNAALIASIAVSFVPLIGPFVGAGIQLADAQKYYNEGDTKMAGMSAMFSLIPLAGPIISKFPILKNLSPKLLQNWKLGKPISVAEKEALETLAKNQSTLQSELNKVFINQADELLKKPSLATTVKDGLLNFTKTGLKIGGKVVLGFAPYIAVGEVYDKSYDFAQRDTPKALVQKENLDWKFVKTAFGSSGSVEDNTLLQQALKDGWKPGTVVPEKYRTKEYSLAYNQEQENLKKLDALLAQYN
jgi:hypothetical protein